MGRLFVNVGSEMILASDLGVELCPPMSYRSAVRTVLRKAESPNYEKNLTRKT